MAGESARAAIGAVLAAWSDLDRLVAQLPEAAAVRQPGPGRASVAWTVGHLANTVDSWINVRFGGHPRHPLAMQDRWRVGADGAADDWAAIREGAAEVRARARAFLLDRGAQELDREVIYDGRLTPLVGRAVPLRYWLSRTVAHTYFHIGAMAADLVAHGISVGDYPDLMLAALEEEG